MAAAAAKYLATKYNSSIGSRTGTLINLMTTDLFLGFPASAAAAVIMPTTQNVIQPSSPAALSNHDDEITTGDEDDNDTTDTFRLKRVLQSSIEALSPPNNNDTPKKIDNIDSMVQFLESSMSVPCRNYHQLQHVFYVALYDEEDPIYQLAGLFHDVIYTSMDGDSLLLPIQYELLQEYVNPDASPKLETNRENDAHFQMVLDIFGIDPSNETTQGGWDEFLSALSAVLLLKPYLDMSVLVQVAVCIQATVPFCPPSSFQKDLFGRFQNVNAKYGLQLSERDLIRSMERAAKMANRDVDNFAYENPALFLDKTWMLLTELNESLRTKNSNNNCLFTASDYGTAMVKMHGFFTQFLNPNYIFKSFGRVDATEQTRVAITNVEIAKQYLGAKLASAGIVNACAVLLHCEHQSLQEFLQKDWIDMLPEAASNNADDWSCNDAVYKILREGRVAETDFDMRQSPLAALLYKTLGNEGIQQELVPRAARVVSSRQGAMELLNAIPKHVVEAVLNRVWVPDNNKKERLLQELYSFKKTTTTRRGSDDVDDCML